MKYLTLYVLIIATPCFTACSDLRSQYRFERHFTKQLRDTLLVDMVTLIGKKPKTADFTSRLDVQYRPYYILLSNDFRIKYFHQADDTCYYFMIRPARSTKGNARGVGGKLILDSANRINYFEETFNTPAYAVEVLERMGWRLFRDLITQRSIEGLLRNVDYIEWPDSRLRYDTDKREWRYVDKEADTELNPSDQ